MRTDDIDVPALREALRETAAAITAIKKTLRTTWTEPMYRQQRQLWALKDKATLLCILRAYVRGRYHFRTPSRRGASPGVSWDQEQFHEAAARRAADRYDLYTRAGRAPEPPAVRVSS